MKKKLLSLLMAAAVVAGSTVPTFAQTYEANDTQTIDADVKVTGTVSNNKGIAPAGKIQVEVPTTLSFTVDQKSNFSAPDLKITNKSQESIEVSVGSFNETINNGGITLQQHGQDLTSLDRSNVRLALKGNNGYVDLANVNSLTKISIIASNDSDNIQLLGDAGLAQDLTGTGVDTNGASEDFNLVFKIAKV